MHGLTVSTTQLRAPGNVVPLRLGETTVSFQELLASVREAGSGTAPTPPRDLQKALSPQLSTMTTVRPGDCLSRLCADQLRERGGMVSRRAVQAAVLAVAKANHISDPNRIYAGQRLDLSPISGSAARQEVPEATTTQEGAPPWQTLVGGARALSSDFGVRQDPFTGQVKQHQGIDVVAPSGAPVSAFEAGRVIFSGWKPGYGTTVILRHEDGLESIYGHLSRSLVKVGETVASHAPIARVGASGHATGAHLHFEVRSQGRATDPLALLKELLPQTTQPGVVLSEGQVGSPSGAPELVLPPRTSRLARSQLGYSN